MQLFKLSDKQEKGETNPQIQTRRSASSSSGRRSTELTLVRAAERVRLISLEDTI